MKHLLVISALALLAACSTAGSTQTGDEPPASEEGGAAGACLVGDPDCQDTGPGIAAPPPEGRDAVPAGQVPYDPDSAPAFVTERPELPSCGSYGVGPRPLPPGVVDCFAAAVQSPEGAEYVVADRTVEGEVVVRYYRALPGGSGVEVLLDATRDAFGSGRWQQIDCTGYDAARAVATGCPPGGTGEV